MSSSNVECSKKMPWWRPIKAKLDHDNQVEFKKSREAAKKEGKSKKKGFTNQEEPGKV